MSRVCEKQRVIYLLHNKRGKRGESYFSKIGDIFGSGFGSGGLYFTGSRLLMLSRNSDVFLAGVDDIRKTRVSLTRLCLLGSSGNESVESVKHVSTDSCRIEEWNEVSAFDGPITSIGLIQKTIGCGDNVNI